MTRQEIEQSYSVEHGIIRSPGKFEGEAVYVPYFWDLFLDGMADNDDGVRSTFDITDEDRAEFPELADIVGVSLIETDNGFVMCEAWTA